MFRVKSMTHSISSRPMSLCSLNSERIVGHFSYIGRTKAVRCATTGIALTASRKALKGDHRETTPRTHRVYRVVSARQDVPKINRLEQDETLGDPP